MEAIKESVIKESYKNSVCNAIDTMDIEEFSMTLRPDNFVDNMVRVKYEIEFVFRVEDEGVDL